MATRTADLRHRRPAILDATGLSGDIAGYLSDSLPWPSRPPEALQRFVTMYDEVKLAERVPERAVLALVGPIAI